MRMFSRLLFSLCIPAVAATGSAGEAPNFIFIMADDLGYNDISPYDGWIDTPNLDRMADEGMRFTDYHSNGAVCSPTRAALMTGRYQQRAGIPGVVFADPDRPVHLDGLQQTETTFPSLLKAKDYVTGMFGKWHLGYFPKYNPVRHGFDLFRGYVSGNVDFFSHVDQAGSFDWWIQDEKNDEPGYVTSLITKHSLEFIKQNLEKRFCLYIPHEAPHSPYQGPSDKPFRVAGQPETCRQTGLTPETIKNAYREMVEEVDQGVGEILDLLNRTDLSRKTLLVFTSDNGANRHGSNQPLRAFKGSVFEGGHRVPALARWPGKIPAGAVNGSLAMTMDWMPTFLSLAGADLPGNLDGIDLSPALLKNKTLPSRKVFWNGLAMRDGRWKYVRDKGHELLFDLEADIAEQDDLAAEQVDRVMEMSAALDAWSAEMEKSKTPQPSDNLPKKPRKKKRNKAKAN